MKTASEVSVAGFAGTINKTFPSLVLPFLSLPSFPSSFPYPAFLFSFLRCLQ